QYIVQPMANGATASSRTIKAAARRSRRLPQSRLRRLDGPVPGGCCWGSGAAGVSCPLMYNYLPYACGSKANDQPVRVNIARQPCAAHRPKLPIRTDYHRPTGEVDFPEPGMGFSAAAISSQVKWEIKNGAATSISRLGTLPPDTKSSRQPRWQFVYHPRA